MWEPAGGTFLLGSFIILAKENQFENQMPDCLLKNKDVRNVDPTSELLKNWALSELTENDKLTSGSSFVAAV
jgi:hypothetical protein